MSAELHLIDSSLWRTDTENPDQADYAAFFVQARERGLTLPQDFYLEATTEQGHSRWRDDAGDSEAYDVNDSPAPLEVKANELVCRGLGLVAYVETTYLNPESPEAINKIRDYLRGPLLDADEDLL